MAEEQWEEDGMQDGDGGGYDEQGRPIPPLTLLQYDDPIPEADAEREHEGFAATIKRQHERSDTRPVITTEREVLNCILPPRSVGDGYVQYVSHKPATRFDVRDLTEMFELRLHKSKARESGICPVRSAIYTMCTDELIRQVAVDCPERGLLLLRVRDELRMTTEAYRTLYEASAGFGRKKAVEAEKGKQEMIDTIEQLSQRKQEMMKEVKRLQAKLRAMERWCQENKEADHKKFATEIGFLRQRNERLARQEKMVLEAQEEERRALKEGNP